MPIMKCKNCNKDFYSKPFLVRNGGGKYCSLKCKYKGTRKGKEVSCHTCGQAVYKPLGRLKRSKSKYYFCTKSCQTIWRNTEFIGPKHANWRHGGSAYRSVLDRNKISKSCTLCGSEDARILAVHHVDRNKLNNRINNLAWLCHNCHHLVHHDSVEGQRFLVKFNKRCK